MLFVTQKDSVRLVAVAMGIKKNIDYVPSSVKNISGDKSAFFMLIAKYPKPTHVA